MLVRVTSGYFLQDLIQLDCPSNRNLVFLLRFGRQWLSDQKGSKNQTHAEQVVSARLDILAPAYRSERAFCQNHSKPLKLEGLLCAFKHIQHQTLQVKNRQGAHLPVRECSYAYKRVSRVSSLMNHFSFPGWYS